jgi:peptide deformylase
MFDFVVDYHILKKPSYPVTGIEEAERLRLLLCRKINEFPTAVGLAAVQIGIHKKIFIIKKDFGIVNAYINPSIVKEEEPFIFEQEGCLSFPGIKINTRRFKKINVEYQYISGGILKRKEETITHSDGDITCVAFQHEMDHLNGVVFFEKEKK